MRQVAGPCLIPLCAKLPTRYATTRIAGILVVVQLQHRVVLYNCKRRAAKHAFSMILFVNEKKKEKASYARIGLLRAKSESAKLHFSLHLRGRED